MPKLHQVHDALHASHKPTGQGGKPEPVGAVRVECGGRRLPDGSVDNNSQEWKVYELRELEDKDYDKFTARRMTAQEQAANPVSGWSGKFEEGELTTDRTWYLVSTHGTEDEALKAAAKL